MEKITMTDVALIAKISENAMAELYRRAFDLVAPKDNWKGKIDVVLDNRTLCYTAFVIADAVGFMTGQKADWKYVNEHEIRFTAPGYYAVVGA